MKNIYEESENKDFYMQILKELDSYQIPSVGTKITSNSPQEIYKTLSIWKGILERISSIYSQIVRIKNYWEMIEEDLESNLENTIRERIVSDEEIKKEKSESLRVASAYHKFKDLQEITKNLNKAKKEYIIAKTVLEEVKLKYECVLKIFESLSRQLTALEILSNIGMYKPEKRLSVDL